MGSGLDPDGCVRERGLCNKWSLLTRYIRGRLPTAQVGTDSPVPLWPLALPLQRLARAACSGLRGHGLVRGCPRSACPLPRSPARTPLSGVRGVQRAECMAECCRDTVVCTQKRSTLYGARCGNSFGSGFSAKASVILFTPITYSYTADREPTGSSRPSISGRQLSSAGSSNSRHAGQSLGAAGSGSGSGSAKSRRTHWRTSGTAPRSRMSTMSSEASGSARKRRGPQASPNLITNPLTSTLTEPSAWRYVRR